MDQIPQIKPQSILDPPKLTPQTNEPVIQEVESSAGKIELPKPTRKFRKRALKFLSVFAVFLLVVFVLGGVLIGIPGMRVYKSGIVLAAQAQKLQASVDTQDISKVRAELEVLKKDLANFSGAYKGLAWMKVLPKVGMYWKDGEAGINAGKYGIETAEMFINTIEPYADIIGFAGANSKEAKSGEDTANDRVEFIIQTIEDVLPKMDEITQKALLAKTELEKIDPSRYPVEFRGKQIRPKLQKAIELAHDGTTMLSQSKPLMEAAPYLLGIDGERKYLLLFQNDKELRPTGGFITAYSVMRVNNGKLNQVSSSDIYQLDNKYKPSIKADKPVIDYLKGVYAVSPNLRLRDMNWSPDFRSSMELFSEEAQKAGLSGYDGIISVDTYVLVKLLDVLGEIGVPGFGNFSTKTDARCNCPQVIYELESFADVEGPVVWDQNDPTKIIFAPKNYDNRKKIVGPLMNSVLANALGQPKEKLAGLFQAGWESVTEKHVMLFLFDEKAQAGAEGFNIAGRIKEYDGDYLHINDANLGGRKSNLYVSQEVHQEISIARDGSIEKTVEITYKNPQDFDGWLNSVLPNWTRVYVPKGSELISTEGFENQAEPYEDLGKTVFSGGFKLRPQGVQKIVLKYKLPIKAKGTYSILLQKQPGTDMPLFTITVGKQKEEFFLKTDKEFKFSI